MNALKQLASLASQIWNYQWTPLHINTLKYSMCLVQLDMELEQRIRSLEDRIKSSEEHNRMLEHQLAFESEWLFNI